MSDESIDDVFDDLLNEDVSAATWRSFLALAGHTHVRVAAPALSAPASGDNFRGSIASEAAARADLQGRGLLLRCLPAIRSALTVGAGAAFLRGLPPSRGPTFRRDAVFALWDLAKGAIGSVTQSAGVGAMICAALLKRGLSSVVSFEGGSSPIEAEIGYVELELKVFPDSVLLLSSGGEAAESLALEGDALEQALEEVVFSEGDPTRWGRAGDILWSILFPRKVETHFERCLAGARALGFVGVRVKLSIEAPKLLSVPWELTRYPMTGEFLGTSRSILFSRYLHRGVRSAPPSVSGLKKLVVVVSDSRTEPTIDAQEEIARIERIAASSNIEILPVSPPSPQALRSALKGSGADAFHYIGHGSFEGDRGTILFRRESGELEKYDAAQLAPLLLDMPALRTVFLNSCEGAVSSDYRAFSGMAAGLVQQGIPVVVAMQRPIRDNAAITFSEVFYRYVASGFSEIYAVQRGRQVLLTETGSAKCDFMTPVVFAGY